MGTTFVIVAYGEDRFKLQAAVDESFAEIRRLDDLLSNYKSRSEWSQVNQRAAAQPVRVSPELFDLLEACQRYSRLSDGAFDISVGALVRTWGFYNGSGRLPHRAEMRAALARTGWRKVELNKENLTVHFTRDGVELDPGGIGKGYAVDRVVDILKQNGIASALVSGGGSSICGLGASPGENGWKVQIRDPRKPGAQAAELLLRDQSLSTSGTAEKFFVAGGRIYSHVFDPRTGYPAPGMLSVSVVAPRAIDSEAWAKPFFINGRRWAEQNKPPEFRAFLCEDKTDTACAWLQ